MGKTEEEILYALTHHIESFHVESLSELKRINQIAKSINKIASIAIRINPNIEVQTHKYIHTGSEDNKFGIDYKYITEIINILHDSPFVRLIGFHIHLGSQMFDEEPYIKALKMLLDLTPSFEDIPNVDISYFSLGGGFGIEYTYPNETLKQFPFDKLKNKLQEINYKKYNLRFEPGRFISAPSGILVSNVLYLKQKTNKIVAVIDAGMTELIRPALYDAKHPIVALNTSEFQPSKKICYDIVGPICESGDFFLENHFMDEIKEGDILLTLYAGAYGSVMSSNYNSRPFVPEIMIDGNSFKVIRRPQTMDDILNLELNID